MIQPSDQRERRTQPLDLRKRVSRHVDGTVARVSCRLGDFDPDEIGRREDRSREHHGGKSGEDRGAQHASGGHDGSLTEVFFAGNPVRGRRVATRFVENPAHVRGASGRSHLETWALCQPAAVLRTFSDISRKTAMRHRGT